MPPQRASDTVDDESARWMLALRAGGTEQDAAVARLHALLVRVSHAEARRRRSQVMIDGPELEDIAHQAANDALLAITAKLDEFRGESRFTTWAIKFVMFEVSKALGRHFWRRPGIAVDAEEWDRLAGRVGADSHERAEWRELVAALRRAIDTELTARQRRLFVAIVLNGVPLDALVVELGTSRNAIYKAIFDARRKIHRALAADGLVDPDTVRMR